MKQVNKKKMVVGKYYMIVFSSIATIRSYIKLLENSFGAYNSYTVYEYYIQYSNMERNILGKGKYDKTISHLDEVFELTDDEVYDLILTEII